MPIDAQVPRKFKPLLASKRYKGAYGGRGSGKSHYFGEQAILRSYMRPMRVVCIREVLDSIRDSVRQLLVDKIDKFKLGAFFKITDSEIRGANGSLIIFKGMQHYNAESIKSLEGYDIAWVEEAQTLSQKSLDLLRPTIRNAGSELWFSWNPRHKDDPVDRFFRGSKVHPEAISVEVNWQDNPFLPAELRQEKDFDYARDPDKAEHIWGGDYQIITEGAYYARLLRQAEKEGRIGAYKPNPQLPVHRAWDLGIGDATAIWFFQIAPGGSGPIILDYYENIGHGIEHYADVCREKPYKPGNDYVPHDAKVREWGTARTRIEMMIAYGLKPELVPSHKVMDGINAARATIPIARFDKANCAKGLDCLYQYRADWDENRQTFRDAPLHDWTSHGADAFRYLSLAWRTPKPVKEEKPKAINHRAGDKPAINSVTIDEMWRHAEMERGREW